MLELEAFPKARIALVRQNQISECGLACIAMIAKFHGLDIDIGTMRRKFGTSLRGAPLKTLISISDRMGFVPRAVKLPLEKLSSLQLPAILHWDLNHYVVVERVKGRRVLVHDPAGQTAWRDIEEVSNHFTGAALELKLGAEFESGNEKERLRFWQLWKHISGIKRALAQALALTLVLQAFVLASPYYLQVAVDTALPALDNDLLAVLAIGFGLFTLLNAAASFLRSLVFLAAGSSVSFSIASNIGRRLFRLQVEWFEKRHTGDVLSRFQSVEPVQSLLTQGAVAAFVDGLLAIFILAVMFWYSALLTFVVVVAVLLYSTVRAVSYAFEREATEASIIAKAKEQSLLIETLRGITTLRLFSRETQRHIYWLAKLTDSINASFRRGRITAWQMGINGLIFGLENVISIWLAISITMKGGGFSIGMIFAFMAYKAFFILRASALIDQYILFRMVGLHLERLADIALSEEDRSFGPSIAIETTLNGKLQLSGVGFQYAPDEPAIFEDADLLVEVGEHIAITGPSGGGKSTLAKIILGLVEPTTGKLLVDGMTLSQFGYRSYHEQVAAVLQDDSLFAGSIAENIALFDERIDMGRVIQSAAAASINEEILQMPMQYESLVGEMGSAVSGGQKQRILMARALYRRPRLLIIDEGTSHLDIENERVVNSSISKLGITRVVIAHRRETIALADRVFVMNSGRLTPAPAISQTSDDDR